jgi:uncharacterized protein YkvS
MTLKVSYFDRSKNEMVTLDIPADVLAVQIPPADEVNGGLPGLIVNVNTDAVIVDTALGDRVAMYEFSDLLAEANLE